MKRLAGKVIALTGAGGGLGRATALAMAAEGARVAITDVDAAGLAETAALLVAQGAEVLSHTGDITLAATSTALVELATARWGALHGLANIAGVLGAGTLEEATAASFDRVMHVNCLAQLLAIQAALPALRQAGGGAIVNVAAIGARVALPMRSGYCAA